MNQLDATTAFINQHLAEQWQSQKLTPAPRCSDEEFLRRASLDIIGRIATPDEVQGFVKDNGADKRAKLIDRLLASEEYAAYWASTWTSWLLPRTVATVDKVRMGPIANGGEMADVPGYAPFSPFYRSKLTFWLNEQFANNIRYKDLVERLLTATGKTNENGAVNFILALLGESNPANLVPQDGAFDMVPITSRSVQVFLGYRIEYAQFQDDHPLSPDWKQIDFWRVNVFFRQMERIGQPPPNASQQLMQNTVLELRDNPSFNAKGTVFYAKPDMVYLPAEPRFLPDKTYRFGRPIAKGSQLTRRQELSRFMTEHTNFALAAVSRMWGQFFGRGFNASPAVDDFGSHNDVILPKLPDRLAQDFADGGYDLKKLIRWMCTSDAYQLQCVSNDTNIDSKREVYFSRMPLKLLSPDQLAGSLAVADPPRVVNFRENVSRLVLGYFDQRFDGNEWPDVPPGDKLIYLQRCLNRKELADLVLSPASATLARGAAQDRARKTVDLLFLTTLNRPATDKEYVRIVSRLLLGGGRLKDEPSDQRQDLYWALLNSSEFILNH